jgi:hypothetical protein
MFTDPPGRFLVRIYFHLEKSNEAIRDREGIEVANLEEARSEVIKAVEELLREDVSVARNWSGWTINVADEGGAVLFSLGLLSRGGPPEVSARQAPLSDGCSSDATLRSKDRYMWQCSGCSSHVFEVHGPTIVNAVVRCAECDAKIGPLEEFMASVEVRIGSQGPEPRKGRFH